MTDDPFLPPDPPEKDDEREIEPPAARPAEAEPFPMHSAAPEPQAATAAPVPAPEVLSSSPAPFEPPAEEEPFATQGAPPPPLETPSPAPVFARSGPTGRGRREERREARGPRPDLVLSGEPLYRDSAGYRMRLEPPDLARLRELPGSKGKTDQELGESFFDTLAERFTASLAEDVSAPADVRVVVDPYSRQAFLAVEKKIRSILSF